jgi:hypothetical protein
LTLCEKLAAKVGDEEWLCKFIVVNPYTVHNVHMFLLLKWGRTGPNRTLGTAA